MSRTDDQGRERALRESPQQRRAQLDRFASEPEGEEALGRIVDVRDVVLPPAEPGAGAAQPERPRPDRSVPDATELARSRWRHGYRR